MTVLTADQAKAELQRKGVSVTEWSKANDLSPGIVFHVLSGKVKGHRGEAHRAAVLLGIREGEILPERTSLKGPLRTLVKAAEAAQ